MDKSIIRECGIDYDIGVARCMNDAGFYKKMMELFLNDVTYSKAEEAHSLGDCKALFLCLHELKGISGNAGMVRLYDAVSPLVELVRGENAEKSEVDRLFADVKAAYESAVAGAKTITEA